MRKIHGTLSWFNGTDDFGNLSCRSFRPLGIDRSIRGLFFSKELFRSVDYRLLVTFACFFVIIGNINEQDKLIEMIQPFFQKNNKPFRQHHPFSGDFQCPSSDSDCSFYNLQESCFVGVNVGGLGTLIASLANLIGYKLIKQALPQEQKDSNTSSIW